MIQSKLPPLQWFGATQELLNSRGRESAKGKLIWELARSSGTDNQGGYLYQVVAASLAFEEQAFRKLIRMAAVEHGCSARKARQIEDECVQRFFPPNT